MYSKKNLLGDSPLLSRMGSYGTPHIAASTMEAQSRGRIRNGRRLLLEFLDSGKPGVSLNGMHI